jgi:hypothetical protein
MSTPPLTKDILMQTILGNCEEGDVSGVAECLAMAASLRLKDIVPRLLPRCLPIRERVQYTALLNCLPPGRRCKRSDLALAQCSIGLVIWTLPVLMKATGVLQTHEKLPCGDRALGC